MLKNQIYVDRILELMIFQDWMTPTCYQEALSKALAKNPEIFADLHSDIAEGIEDGYDPNYMVLLIELSIKHPIILN